MIKVKDYKPRTTAPEAGNPWYTCKGTGKGTSPCIKGYPMAWNSTKLGQSTLNNCVGYVFGEMAEQTGQYQKVGIIVNGVDYPQNAQDWYNGKLDGCERSKTPKVGAIACWRRVLGGKVRTGHVAEVVATDGTNAKTIVAESGYGTYKFRLHNYGKNMYKGIGWQFQGYIIPNWIDYSEEKDDSIPVGTKVKILARGNARADGKGSSCGGVGWTRYVLAYNKDAAYQYKVGNAKGVVTGYYKREALEVK